MQSDAFWRRHDWFWRIYDWAERLLGIAGISVAGMGAAVIGAIAVFVEGFDPIFLLLVILVSFAALAMFYIGACRFWDRAYPVAQQLKYLSGPETELGSSVIAMADYSAWGRWYAARHLVNAGSPITHERLYQVAASEVMKDITNGEITVRGRRPDPQQLGYEIIDRTHWRSSWLACVRDPVSLWRIKLIPKGGVELNDRGKIVRADNETASQRTSLLDYDSLLVDSYEFERAWPRNEIAPDRERKRLLRQAIRRNLDANEIQRLS
jgi:hypothetical protein